VWTSVDLYLTHPDWSLSDIARHLELHTSTVSRHIKAWTQVQQNIASERSTATPGEQAPITTETGHDHSTDAATDARSGYDDADYDSMGTNRDYVGALR
jgi:hypothetical protein